MRSGGEPRRSLCQRRVYLEISQCVTNETRRKTFQRVYSVSVFARVCEFNKFIADRASRARRSKQLTITVFSIEREKEGSEKYKGTDPGDKSTFNGLFKSEVNIHVNRNLATPFPLLFLIFPFFLADRQSLSKRVNHPVCRDFRLHFTLFRFSRVHLARMNDG